MNRRAWTYVASAAAVLGAGLAIWHISRPARRGPLVGLVVWRRSDLPAPLIDVVAKQGWDYVSVKVVDGSGLFQPTESAMLVGELSAREVTVHGWGYHYCRTDAEAYREAQVAAGACRRYGLPDYHFNAEADYWAKADNPRRTATVFAQRFRALAPGVRLWANTCSGSCPEAMDAATLSFFDVWEPMNYATRPSTYARLFTTRLNRFGKDRPRAFMVGTGRLESGQVRGFFYDQAGSPGLRTLVQRERPYAISYYRAPFMLTQSNAANPSLGAQLQALQAVSYEALA